MGFPAVGCGQTPPPTDTPTAVSGKGRHCVQACQDAQNPAVCAHFPETSLCSPGNDSFLFPPGLKKCQFRNYFERTNPWASPVAQVLTIRPGVWPGVWPGHQRVFQVLQRTRCAAMFEDPCPELSSDGRRDCVPGPPSRLPSVRQSGLLVDPARPCPRPPSQRAVAPGVAVLLSGLDRLSPSGPLPQAGTATKASPHFRAPWGSCHPPAWVTRSPSGC